MKFVAEMVHQMTKQLHNKSNKSCYTNFIILVYIIDLYSYSCIPELLVYKYCIKMHAYKIPQTEQENGFVMLVT